MRWLCPVLIALSLGCSGSERKTPVVPAHDERQPTTAPGVPRGFVVTKGALLSTARFGSASSTREVVVLIHDWAHDDSVFYAQASALRSRYTVVTYDLRGHGESTDIDSSGASVDDHARDLISVLDEVTPDQGAHLVGHGVGGWIAMTVAAKAPGRVKSIALLSTLVSYPVASREALAAMVDRFDADPTTFADWSGRLVPVWLSSKFLNSQPNELARFDTMLDRHDPASVVGTLRKTLRFEVTVDTIAAVQVPVLVLFGALDEREAASDSEQLLDRFVDVKRLRIPDAGPMLPLENAAAVNRALVRHLAAL